MTRRNQYQTTTLLRRLALLGIGTMCFASPAPAGDVQTPMTWYWTEAEFGNPFSGFFAEAERWTDETMKLSGVPSAIDDAVFDVPSAYTVFFDQPHLSDRAFVLDGSVQFELNGFTYTLLNDLISEPSLTIGMDADDAALLSVRGGTLAAHHVVIATQPGSFGMLSFLGSNAQLNTPGTLSIGSQGTGLLELASGAHAAALSAVIGGAEGGIGHAAIDNGAVLDLAGPLTIGNVGVGSLVVRSGGQVHSGAASIALNEDGAGVVTVEGAGSLWTIDGSLDLGMRGDGSLFIENGGAVSSDSFIVVGNTVESFSSNPEWLAYGQVFVRSPGSMLSVGGTLHLGLIAAGELHVEDGGRVIIAGNLERTNASDHRIVLSEASAQYSTAGGGPAMDIAGDVFNLGLEVALADGYVPDPGQSFHLISAASIDDAEFVDLPPLPQPLGWTMQLTETDLTITVLGEAIPGDLNGDGVINVADLLLLLADWGFCNDCPADLNDDNLVNVLDLLALLSAWT